MKSSTDVFLLTIFPARASDLVWPKANWYTLLTSWLRVPPISEAKITGLAIYLVTYQSWKSHRGELHSSTCKTNGINLRNKISFLQKKLIKTSLVLKGKGKGGGEGHLHRVIGVDPWSLTMKNENNHFSLRWAHTSKTKRPKYKSYQITFCRPENSSYKTILIELNCSVMSSLYSHITPGRIFSVKQRLNGSQFYRETPLNKKQKCEELAYSLKSTNAPNDDNTVTKVPGNGTGFTELFSLSSHSSEAS